MMNFVHLDVACNMMNFVHPDVACNMMNFVHPDVACNMMNFDHPDMACKKMNLDHPDLACNMMNFVHHDMACNMMNFVHPDMACSIMNFVHPDMTFTANQVLQCTYQVSVYCLALEQSCHGCQQEAARSRLSWKRFHFCSQQLHMHYAMCQNGCSADPNFQLLQIHLVCCLFIMCHL